MPKAKSNYPNFTEQYRQVFARLGCRLTARDAIPAAKIASAEKKLGVRLPAALRNYYLVAGRERLLNQIFNRLWTPGEWELHRGKLIFMEENQGAVVWGVTATSATKDDPAVFQSAVVDGEPDKWYQEQRQCSIFLSVMLHWQAAFGGGMPCRASAPPSAAVDDSLKRKWQFAGENNKMRAFSRDGQAVCMLPWRDFGKEPGLRIFAGASTKDGLDAIARDLHLQWD